MIDLINLTTDKKTKALIIKEIDKVINERSFILGRRLELFEKKFAKFIGTKYAIGVGNGTDALRLSLRALGIGSGDKVLTVALTSPFTVLAIIEEGAIPVFCDVNEKTWTINTVDIQKKIDKRTKAIIPVHLFGNPCDMDTILKLAKKYKLKVIEDACQAHGAEFKKKKIGTFGDAAAFSFYPTKNLGAFGDGGIVTTNNPNISKMIRLLRHGGQTKRFWHQYKGINSRLDEIQAAILEVKLKYLQKNNLKRKILSKRYQKYLSKLPLKFQKIHLKSKSSYHLFVIGTKHRKKLRKFLDEENISTDIYYPYPVHSQPAFNKFEKNNLPITEKLTKELVALPFYPEMKKIDQDKVIKAIKTIFSN